MRKSFSTISLGLLLAMVTISFGCKQESKQKKKERVMPVIVIHGGAGLSHEMRITEERHNAALKAMDEALKKGWEMLEEDKNAVDVVEAVIVFLENTGVFNAGKGSVLNNEDFVENDASLMNGKDLKAGSVSSLRGIKNPILAARLVMERTPHIMLSGKGARQFAIEHQLDTVYDDYYVPLKHYLDEKNSRNSTVGCVVLDRKGNLAAGTSTGGMTQKKFGRIGDTPIIGAGTYANNKTCAVSSTGWGEHFIKNVGAYQVSARMEFGQEPLAVALRNTLKEIENTGGDGGFIAVDKYGNWQWIYNSAGMFRGVKTPTEHRIAIYEEDIGL